MGAVSVPTGLAGASARAGAVGESLLEVIAEQHRAGLTIVMVTHDQWIAARGDRTVHLVDGRVA